MKINNNNSDHAGINELKHHLKGIKICKTATVPYFVVSQLKRQAEYLRDMGIEVILVAAEGI